MASHCSFQGNVSSNATLINSSQPSGRLMSVSGKHPNNQIRLNLGEERSLTAGSLLQWILQSTAYSRGDF